MSSADLGRLLTPMVTPFDEELEVDFAAAEGLAEALVAEGVDGVVLADVTGEGPTMTDEEKVELVRRVRHAVPSAPVAAVLGGSDTRRAVELSKRAAEAGADAVVCPVPPCILPSREGLHRHFELVSQLAGIPVILQNDPARSGTVLTAAMVFRLANLAGVAGVWEASGDLENLGLICAAGGGYPVTPPPVWAGDEFFLLPGLAAGAWGLISVVSHLAAGPVREVMDANAAGEVERARRLYNRLFHLIRTLDLGRTNPAPLKAALRALGLPGCHHRPPVVPPTAADARAVEEALSDAGDLVSAALRDAVGLRWAAPGSRG